MAQVVERQAGGDANRPIGTVFDIGLLFVVLVGNFSDDFFQNVLDSDQPGRATVFINDYREVNAGRLHLAQ
ncbi:unannotated protein [freshwater metagenome]|uniref:Unannotated protein n=1 Tax=freshwater metagenome TaxID=449393 RepID=A0A6J6XT54_9ZZZZ